MRRALVLVAFALVAAVPAATRAGDEPGVLAIDWRTWGDERLVIADPLTLSPRTRGLQLDGHAWPYALSPDRSELVLGRWQPPSLRFVAANDLRLLRDVPLGGTRRVEIKAVAWLGRHVVVLLEPKPASLVLVRVDSRSGRVVASIPLGRGAAEVEATAAWLVVLVTPRGRIGSPRLVVATRARVRTIELSGVEAGSLPAQGRRPHTVVQPGLAVSRAAARAWVIGAARSAEVDLRTLSVRYLGDVRRPSAAQKEPVVGSARDAAWLAPGRLVVAGWDAPDDRPTTPFEPTGLRLLDTRTWAEEVVHTRALLFYVRPPRLLTMAPGEPDCAASALTAYTLRGVELYRVCDRKATGEIEFAGRYARLGRVDGRVAVVDVATGRVVARVRGIRVAPLATTLVQEP